MEKSTFGKRNLNTRGLLPVAAGFMLMPSFLFAQTEKQVQAIKKETNLHTLKILQTNLAKNTLTTKQLQAKAKEKGVLFSGESEGQHFQLKGFDKKTGRPLYYITTNAGAAAGTMTDKLNSSAGIFNLDGEGMKVHEWDGGGVRVEHQEFGGRVTQKDTPSANSSHATHVAGTMVASGVNAMAKGMAPKANLDAYDWSNDTTEMVDAAMNGALVSNHSYGFVSGFTLGTYSGSYGWHWLGDDEDTEYKYYGKYTEDDRNWDIIAQNAVYYLPVKAAGNPRGDGPAAGGMHYVNVYDAASGKWVWRTSTKVRQKNGGEFGFDSITNGALGKNILTIGAAHKIAKGYKTASDVKMASFSAFGPVDDGRIKPDLSGIGVGVVSTTTGGNASYVSQDGTSMASPNVTGSLLLLQEHYKNVNSGNFMKAATLKALAIATANEAGDAPGPDYKSGWGLLNAYKAATAISTNGKYSIIAEKTLRNKATDKLSVVASGLEPLVVTIAWTDPAPKDLPSEITLNERLATLVNDLDIRVKKNGEVYLPWKLDPANPNNAATKEDNAVDNVEQVVIESPEAGATYEIEITHKGTLKQNVFNTQGGTVNIALEDAAGQDYSLVVTGINNGVTKDLAVESVEIKVSAAQYTQATPVEFGIVNKGSEAVSGAKLRYKLINVDSNTEVHSAELDLEEIAIGGSLKKQVTLNLSQSFVNYKIEGEIVFPEDAVAVNNKGVASALGVLADITAKNASHSFGFEDDFEKNGWTSEDADQDGNTWKKYDAATLAYEGASFAVNFPGFKGGSNDWLFSNPLKVKANTTYRVVFHTRKFQGFEEPIEVFMGTEATSTAMTTLIGTKVLSPSGSYSRYHYEFTSPLDQTIYIGFNNKVDATATSHAVALDNVTIQNAEGVPLVGFKTDKTQVNSYETVSLTSEVVTASNQPATGYLWSFEPNDVTYVENTSATSEHPKVVLNQQGVYKVSLSVTNVEGTATETKEGFITVKNTPVKAAFTNAVSAIEEGEMITFTNASTGNPVPTEFAWTVTPSDGVEFTSQTNANSQNTVIKFSKYGTYEVALKAKSAFSEDVATTTVEVAGIHEGVKNLKSTLENGKDVTLTWAKPNMKDAYFEGFESGTLPADVTVIDENNDKLTWKVVNSEKKTGSYSIEGKSWSFATKAVNSNDWLVLPKVRKGAEVLKFSARNQYKERYDVYIVEAPASGQAPTLDEVKAGQKIYSFDATSTTVSFRDVQVDIKPYTSKDFFVAFHQRTTKADSGYALYIDDIKIGYNNEAASGKTTQSVAEERASVDYKALVEEGKTIVTEEMLGTSGEAQTSIIQEYGVLDTPYVVSYEVVKNGEKVSDLAGFDAITYQETLSANGTYTYDVYAVYSDGVKSDKRTVTVDITTLSTSDVKNEDLKIYPNPSDGRFVVDAGSGVTSLKAEVYDMSGKQIYKQDFRGNKADLNLTQYPKGVYILNLVDNNGKKQSAKLMIK